MEKDGNITRVSAEEAQAMLSRGESLTDWKRVRALTQVEADRLADEEDGPLPESWESTVEIGLPKAKEGVTIRLDSDVLKWFRSHGRGYQTRINSVLRAFVSARERADGTDPQPK